MDDTVNRRKDTHPPGLSESERSVTPIKTASSGDEQVLGPEDSRRAREVRQEIADARDQLSETIDALQEKLHPRTIAAGAKARMKQATTERLQATAERLKDMPIIETARQNPIPAALIGCGTAWLLMSRSGSRSDRSWDEPWRRGASGALDDPDRHYSPDAPYSGDWGEATGFWDRLKEHPLPAIMAGVGLAWLGFSTSRDGRTATGARDYDYSRRGMTGSVSDLAGHAADRAQDYAREMSDTVSDTATHVADRVQAYAREATASVSEAAGRAQEYARDAGAKARRTGRRVQTRFERMIDENPLIISGAALLIGLALGLVLPETEQENAWMGEARDTVMDQAETAARQVAQTVQNAAGDMAGDVVNRVVSGKL
jgi:hypothetical protein